MSRRKQEKPQPRKNLIKGEPDVLGLPDLLTCGACQKHFPLGEIVRFIQHKVQTCNKENHLFPYEDEEEEEDGEPPSSTPVLVVPKKEVLEDEDRTRCGVKEEPVSSSSVVSRVTSATTQSENNLREPRSYVCSTCKRSSSTAWALIQHVQDAHGLSICVDSSSSSTSDEPSERPAALGLRAPLLERQTEPLPLFTPRNSSQELRLDLIGNGPVVPRVTPPPLLEPPKMSGFQDSSYSQRLRVLAGATSPDASCRKLLPSGFKAMLDDIHHAASPPRSGTPPELTSSLASPQSSERVHTNHSSASSTTGELPSQSSSKNRLCEYCGKSFQFRSNLIVHRRSHTGEKPFKCHVCSHACTQASKLKRHMKTHRTTSVASGRTAEDASSSAKQTNGDGEYGSDDRDEDPDEEEEDEEDEEEINVDGLEEEDRLRENGGGDLVIDHPAADEDAVAEDLSKKPADDGTRKEDGRSPSENGNNNNNKRPAKHSVISEIMEKIGFGRIPPYNEAYRQALKESSYHGNHPTKRDRRSSGTEASDDAASHHSYDVLPTFHPADRPPREGTRSAGQSPLSFGSGLLDCFDPSVHLKRIRLDESSKEKEGNFLYAGVWFPRVEAPPHHRAPYGPEAHANGRSESASRPGPSCKAKDASQTPRRNDTCEFCGKVFKNCSNLTVHRRSHTGEKPYKCELCSYACAQSSKLTRHMKTHGRLGKDVYRCRFCDMPFSVASTLEKHMRKCVVSQGSPYLVSEDSKEMTAA